MDETKDFTKGTINIYICYNSVQEFIDAAHKTREECKQDASNYTEDMFENNFYGGKIQPQILIRTSNEVRLSNFMLFQGKNWQINFVKNYWPDFSLWDFFKIILGNLFL